MGHTDVSLVGRLFPVWVQSHVDGNVDAHCFSSLLTVETVQQGVLIVTPLVCSPEDGGVSSSKPI